MEELFYYAVLRISIAQLLKAQGFDKCKPLTLNTITDIYIKHLELVLNSALKFGHARTRSTNVLEAPDLLRALLDVQLIKPLTGDSILEVTDAPNEPETEYNVKSLESFVKWLQFSDSFSLSKRLSDVPSSQLRNLMEKRKIDTLSETDQEKKKRRLRERQEYYNQLKLGENPANTQFSGIGDDLEEAEVTENDKLSWLAYLAEKDVKLGHNLQYVNTVLHDMVLPIHKNSKYHPSKDGEDAYLKFLSHAHNNVRNDHILLNIQDAEGEDESNGERIQPSQKLKDALPYNVKYEESLLNDDLQQYIEYAEKHGFPATPKYNGSPEPMEVDSTQSQNGTEKQGDDSQDGETDPTTVKAPSVKDEEPESSEATKDLESYEAVNEDKAEKEAGSLDPSPDEQGAKEEVAEEPRIDEGIEAAEAEQPEEKKESEKGSEQVGDVAMEVPSQGDDIEDSPSKTSDPEESKATDVKEDAT